MTVDNSMKATLPIDVIPLEKASTEHQEKKIRYGLSAEEEDFLLAVDEKEARKIFRKVDFRLVPMLALLYLASHLDRANIGNAKIEGMEADLGMTGTDYNTVNLIFFIPYVLAELPSNIILLKFKRPSYWIGILVVGWSIAMLGHGFMRNFSGLAACRALLGLFEAGFFPAAVYLVGRWYPPSKTQTRVALFYCASAASGAFSGLLAAGIAKMDGLAGYEGWRWIFIIEALATLLAGISTFWLLPDTPTLATWLTPDEKRYLEILHTATRGRTATIKKQADTRKTLISVLKEGHLYLQALVFAGAAIPLYGIKFTMPQIVRNMGFTSTTAQLMTAPPYIVGAMSALTSAWFADRLTWRMPFLVGPMLVLIAGFATIFAVSGDLSGNVAPAYFSLFLVCGGIYPLLPGNQAWTSNNLAGPAKRGMGLGLMIMTGNLSGFVGSYIYIDSQRPTYPVGYGVSLGIVSCAILACFALEFIYRRKNRANEKFTEEEVREKYTDEELDNMGDKSPLFRFSY